MIRTFVLDRTEDVNGVSGTGMVATGAQFPDGTVVIRWTSDTPSTVVWNSIEDALAVHSHGGKTTVRWLTGEPTTLTTLTTPTTLQRVAALMENDGDLRKYSTLDWHADSYFRLQVHGRDLWLAWITALHGSPDGVNAAVRVDRRSTEFPFEWHWMTPDGAVQVMYLEPAERIEDPETDDQS